MRYCTETTYSLFSLLSPPFSPKQVVRNSAVLAPRMFAGLTCELHKSGALPSQSGGLNSEQLPGREPRCAKGSQDMTLEMDLRSH